VGEPHSGGNVTGSATRIWGAWAYVLFALTVKRQRGSGCIPLPERQPCVADGGSASTASHLGTALG